MMQKSGDRRLTNRHFLRRQYGLELSQRDIRLLCHQLPDQVLVRRQSIPLVSAEFGRTDTARFAVEPTKADHRADTHTEALRNFRYRGALLRRPHHARTQILRIRLPHPILASFPARILNPIRVRMGIPPDSVFSGNALRLCTGTTIAPRYLRPIITTEPKPPMWRQRHSGGLWSRWSLCVDNDPLARLRSPAPNGSPFALPFSEFGWRAFSKNRVKPLLLLLLDTGQQCAFSQNS